MRGAAVPYAFAVVLGVLVTAGPSWGQSAGSAVPDAAAASTEATFDAGTAERLRQALQAYSEIHARGGWPTLPEKAKLAPGAKGPGVAVLRRRLAVTNDLSPEKEKGEIYDNDVVDGVKRFQSRHGLEVTGSVGAQTLAAMNVPVAARIRQLKGSLERLASFDFTFAQLYVALNIPGDKVERSSIVVVGSRDHESPTLTAAINQVVLNPTWTVPLSITKNEIIKKVRKDKRYLERMHMRVFSGEREISPRSINWSSDRAPNFSIRQDSGTWNALGAVKIDMPNRHAVYMHDTNMKNVFDANYRFLSHGCARVKEVRELATWVLQDVPGWDRAALDAAIAQGDRREVKLPKKIPVAWIYLTGWMKRDGTVQFRNDVYGLDKDVEVPLGPVAQAATRSMPSAGGRVENPHLDSR
jgi:murein L,D-transpeptidase YcbB/YkuD